MTKIKLNENVLMRFVDLNYEKVVEGIKRFDSASKLAENYMKNCEDPMESAKSLIRWQNTKAGTSGFITGLGGILLMPISIPANLASVLFLQIRMIAAIAYIGNHDLNDDKIKSLIYLCLAGNGAKDIMKDVGIVFGKKLTINAIKKISGKTITAINQKVGFRLLVKFGEKGVINLGKSVPLIGGIIGASFDILSTNAIGNIAIRTFIGNNQKANKISESL